MVDIFSSYGLYKSDDENSFKISGSYPVEIPDLSLMVESGRDSGGKINSYLELIKYGRDFEAQTSWRYLFDEKSKLLKSKAYSNESGVWNFIADDSGLVSLFWYFKDISQILNSVNDLPNCAKENLLIKTFLSGKSSEISAHLTSKQQFCDSFNVPISGMPKKLDDALILDLNKIGS